MVTLTVAVRVVVVCDPSGDICGLPGRRSVLTADQCR